MKGLFMDDFETILKEISQYTQELRDTIIVDIDDDKMNEFKKIIHDFYIVADKYNDMLNQLIHSIETDTKRTEFCIQSECLHRGYYCPSPILDLIVGGIKRGKLTAKPYKTTEEYYKYYFNNENRMIAIENYAVEPFDFSPYEIEFIIREDSTEYGVTFHNGWKEISYISKAEYENGIVKNYSAVCYNKDMSEEETTLHHEVYFYTGVLLSKAIVYFNISPELNLYSRNEYIFKYDEAGKILEYDVLSEYQGEPTKETYSVKR